MNERVRKLRDQSLASQPSISAERALLLTEFYQAEQDQHSVPVMRALSFKHLCEHKTIFIGEGELIVGERGPEPLAVPTFPELTCHTPEDLEILDVVRYHGIQGLDYFLCHVAHFDSGFSGGSKEGSLIYQRFRKTT